jgi:hypothetical protein
VRHGGCKSSPTSRHVTPVSCSAVGQVIGAEPRRTRRTQTISLNSLPYFSRQDHRRFAEFAPDPDYGSEGWGFESCGRSLLGLNAEAQLCAACGTRLASLGGSEWILKKCGPARKHLFGTSQRRRGLYGGLGRSALRPNFFNFSSVSQRGPGHRGRLLRLVARLKYLDKFVSS